MEGPDLGAQERFWNDWLATNRELAVGPVSNAQADRVLGWLSALDRTDLDILDVGCGSGWMCERLTAYGRVTGIDLAGEVIERARARLPPVRFIAGDFATLDLGTAQFDVVVTLEVLSHVADQTAFIDKLASVLRPGGLLMMATQNRFVLERSENVAPRAEGQIRHWVNHVELRTLLRARFDLVELSSVFPNWGHKGILRIVNSPRLNALLARFVSPSRLGRAKERVLLGHTLMALARRRS